MCNYCKPFNDRSIKGLKGAIRASVSYTEDPEPTYVVDVEHWESNDAKQSVVFRKVSSTIEIKPNFCPICSRDLREGGQHG